MDRHHIERKHDKRFLGMFLMFSVLAVVLGLTLAFTIQGTKGTITGNSFWSWLFGTNTENAGASSKGSVSATNCSDTDGGINYFVQGICYENSVIKGTDVCYGNTTCLEYSCSSQNKCIKTNMSCANVNGSNGQCVEGACQRMPECNDSDGGIQIYWKGVVSYLGVNFEDYCWDNGTNVTNSSVLAEFYCDSSYPARILAYCTNGCLDGACNPEIFGDEPRRGGGAYENCIIGPGDLGPYIGEGDCLAFGYADCRVACNSIYPDNCFARLGPGRCYPAGQRSYMYVCQCYYWNAGGTRHS